MPQSFARQSDVVQRFGHDDFDDRMQGFIRNLKEAHFDDIWDVEAECVSQQSPARFSFYCNRRAR